MQASIDKFSHMVGKTFKETRVLFIPTDAFDEEAKTIANILKTELLWLGFLPDNIPQFERIRGKCAWEKVYITEEEQEKCHKVIDVFAELNKIEDEFILWQTEKTKQHR